MEQLLSQILEEPQKSYNPDEFFWSRVDRESINEYMASLKAREYSSATISRKIASLRSFFGFLIDEKFIDRDYLEKLIETFASHYHNYDDGPLLIVNTTSIDLINNHEDYEQLLDQIKCTTGGRHFFNPLTAIGFS